MMELNVKYFNGFQETGIHFLLVYVIISLYDKTVKMSRGKIGWY